MARTTEEGHAILSPNELESSSSSSRYSTTRTDVNNQEVAEAVKQYLVPTDAVTKLPGCSVTHEVYKWTKDHHPHKMKRSQSEQVHQDTHSSLLSDPHLDTHLKDPGGFRRYFVVNQQKKKLPSWISHSFVDFLAMYGRFGGEDLMSDDEEERPLLNPPPPRNQQQSTATSTKAVFLLLKSFIGTGVMFLPKAFHNGGLLFSTVVLMFIAAVTLYSYLLLVKTRSKVPASFGDIGGKLYGNKMRILVLSSITIAQVGFVCAYMVFVAQNAQVLLLTAFKLKCPLYYLILGQVAIYVPLGMVRKIQKLSFFALIADVFILLGLSYIYYYDIYILTTEGVGKVEWVINSSSFPMFIGTSVFTFEGVGLIIPITESMKEPQKFPRVLSLTMCFIALLFISFGLLSYLAFGEQVETVILLNLPSSDIVNTIQGLYAAAISLSIPLQLFPAIRIIETGLFSKSGKYNLAVKWQKNLFRFGSVCLCALIAIMGSNNLDKFVSLIGSICCIPLCFLFPPLFHLKAVAHHWLDRTLDVSIIVFGTSCMIYTTLYELLIN